MNRCSLTVHRPTRTDPMAGTRRCRICRHGAGRRGVLLAAVIVCLAIASALFLGIVKTAAGGRQVIRSETWRSQAAWLAESGLERAARRLAVDENYPGETWTLSAEAFGGEHAETTRHESKSLAGGVVKIEVLPMADEPDRRLVRVRADYPEDPRHRARQTRQTVVQLPSVEVSQGETNTQTEKE